MDQNLAAGLARALNLSPAEAERAVAAIGRQLRERLDASGAVRVDGVGTFRRTDDGIAFDPAPPLAAAVNHRFAGLPAVPAPDLASGPPAPPELPTEDPFGSVHAAPELHLPEEIDAPPTPIRDLASEPEEAAPPEPVTDPAGENVPDEPESDPAGETVPDEPESDPAGEAEEFEDDDAAPHPEEAAPDGLDADVDDDLDTWAAEDEDAWAAFPDMPLISDQDLLSQEDLDAASGDADPETAPEPAGDATGETDEDDEWATLPYEPEQDEQELPAIAPAGEADDVDDSDDLDALIEGVWTPRTGPADEEHPLGPPPEDLLEDADFLVLEGSAPAGTADEPSPTEDSAPSDAHAAEQPLAAAIPAGDEPPPAAAEPPPPADAPGFAASRDPEPAPQRGRRRWPWVVVALLLIGGVAVALWYLQPGPAGPDPAPDPVAATPPPAAEEPAETEEPAPAGEEEPAPPTDDPLRSPQAVDPAGGGYTWVISEPSQAAADSRMERYRQQGYRVAVIPATVRGATYFRVAIGQFESRAEAEQHRGQLPPDAPTDIWILAL
jgi:hypothetical protein